MTNLVGVGGQAHQVRVVKHVCMTTALGVKCLVCHIVRFNNPVGSSGKSTHHLLK